MTFELEPLSDPARREGESASARAYRLVLDSIVTGRTAPATLLTEGDVAETLGVSRTPVREAFLRLATEGVLVLLPKKGVLVTAPSDTQVRDLLRTRVMFESAAVGWIAESAVPPGLEPVLRGHIHVQEQARDALAFSRADRDLHEAVVRGAGNALASALFAQTGAQLLRAMHRVADTDPPARARLVGEHRDLVGALLARDAPGYRDLLRRHVQAVHRVDL